MTLQSEISCPKCAHKSLEDMPETACVYFYECRGCGALLQPLEGDCCVFCSFGSVKCPPMQSSAGCCTRPSGG